MSIALNDTPTETVGDKKARPDRLLALVGKRAGSRYEVCHRWVGGREFLVIVEVDAHGVRGEVLVPHDLARELSAVFEDIAELLSPTPVHRTGQLGFVFDD